MRYFLTVNASRPHVAGGLTFVFEPVSNRGGSWLGILAVEEDSAASTLAAASLPGVDEIPLERYDSLKKKLTGTRTGPSESHVRQPRRTARDVAVARVADRREGIRGSIVEPKAEPVIQKVTAVTLLTTSKQPPREALLDAPSIRPTRKFGRAA